MFAKILDCSWHEHSGRSWFALLIMSMQTVDLQIARWIASMDLNVWVFFMAKNQYKQDKEPFSLTLTIQSVTYPLAMHFWAQSKSLRPRFRTILASRTHLKPIRVNGAKSGSWKFNRGVWGQIWPFGSQFWIVRHLWGLNYCFCGSIMISRLYWYLYWPTLWSIKVLWNPIWASST